tara:strand:- start:819 stop:1571 length:753 start_codon:yes stop_codon:yes gene_type:complete
MTEIPEIRVQNVDIPRIQAPSIYNYVPHTQTYPFILHIGSPIVDMPGCVKFHPDSAKNRETPNLKEEDSQGTKVLCDGQYPMYDAMDYTPEDLLIQVDTPPPVVQPPPEIDPPEVPPTGDIGGEEVPCPGPNNLRVGDLTLSGDERVTGHELSADGKVCVTLYEPTTTAEKFLPSPNQATTTVAIAVIATAGAAATPLLLRLIKPAVKKAIATLQKKIGTHRGLSKSEIIANRYREKKGLPPLKIRKKKP